MPRASKASADDKTVEVRRCPATEGAQQCVSATHGPLQNHRWGKRGEGPQWNADGTAKARPDRDGEGGDATVEIPTPVVQIADVAMDDAGHLQAIPREGSAPPPGSRHADLFNGEAQRKAEARRAEIAAAVTPEEIAEMHEIGARRRDAILPPPISATALPGHSIGEVAADDVMDSLLFDDTDDQLKAERIWLRTLTRTALRIAAERHRYGKLGDAEQIMAIRDQAEQLVANRGLGGGSA